MCLLIGAAIPLCLAVLAADPASGTLHRELLLVWLAPATSFLLMWPGYRLLWRYTVFERTVGYAAVALCAGLILLGLASLLRDRMAGPGALPWAAAALWLALTAAAWPGFRHLYDHGDIMWIMGLRPFVSLAASVLSSTAVCAASFTLFLALRAGTDFHGGPMCSDWTVRPVPVLRPAFQPDPFPRDFEPCNRSTWRSPSPCVGGPS